MERKYFIGNMEKLEINLNFNNIYKYKIIILM